MQWTWIITRFTLLRFLLSSYEDILHWIQGKESKLVIKVKMTVDRAGSRLESRFTRVIMEDGTYS